MTAPFSSFAGSSIYLDTMMPYMLLRGIEDSLPLFERIEGGELLAYTSVLTFDELAYRLMLALIKDHYEGSPLDHLRDDEEKMMTEFAPMTTSLLQRLRDYSHLTVIDVLATDVDIMTDAMKQHHLRPRDALHYAAMQSVGCMDLASNDPHFDRIPEVRRYTVVGPQKRSA